MVIQLDDLDSFVFGLDETETLELEEEEIENIYDLLNMPIKKELPSE